MSLLDRFRRKPRPELKPLPTPAELDEEIARMAAVRARAAALRGAALVHVGAHVALTRRDKCDAACPAAAQVRIRLRSTGGRLDFCKHHFERYELMLRLLCDAVLDDRERLLKGTNE